jgi:hypothetical protein
MSEDNITQNSHQSLESPPESPQGPYGFFIKGTNSPDRQRTSPSTKKHPPPKLSDLNLEEEDENKKSCSILERLTGSCSIMGGKSRFRKRRTKRRRKKRKTRRKIRKKRKTKKRRYRRKSSKRRRKRR